MKLYENIKKLRIKNGWDQKKLADLAGYKNRATIAKIENGKIDLSQTKIETFARIFNVSPVDLMGFEDHSEILSEINLLFDQLTEEQQRATLAFVTVMLGERK